MTDNTSEPSKILVYLNKFDNAKKFLNINQKRLMYFIGHFSHLKRLM